MVSTNGHPSQERPTIRRLHALPSPCKTCGAEATILYTTHSMVPQTSRLLTPSVGVGRQAGAGIPMDMGPGIEAHLLCMCCLRREHWTPNGKDWESKLISEGEHGDGIPASPDS